MKCICVLSYLFSVRWWFNYALLPCERCSFHSFSIFYNKLKRKFPSNRNQKFIANFQETPQETIYLILWEKSAIFHDLNTCVILNSQINYIQQIHQNSIFKKTFSRAWIVWISRKVCEANLIFKMQFAISLFLSFIYVDLIQNIVILCITYPLMHERVWDIDRK